MFFGVDLAREQLQQVGDAFRELTGANQALALRDGIIRIEDFNRDFSSNNELIVDQLKASIIKVELAFGDAEKSIVASLGGSITEFDRLIDSTAESTLTATERVIGAYSRASNISIQEAQSRFESSGIAAERYLEIFGSASGRVLTELVGVTDQIGASLGEGFQGFEVGALGSLSLVEGGLVDLTGVALENARQIGQAYADANANATQINAPQLVTQNQQPVTNQRLSVAGNSISNAQVAQLVSALEADTAATRRAKANQNAA